MSADQPTQRRPPSQIPADMKAFNRKVIEEFRANHGKLSATLPGSSVLLLTTTGVKTGQRRTVVVGFGKDEDRYVVIASNNGARDHPLWYRNLQTNANATVEVGAARIGARARTARPEERERLSALVPYIKSQQELTTREIPIVVLEPVAKTPASPS